MAHSLTFEDVLAASEAISAVVAEVAISVSHGNSTAVIACGCVGLETLKLFCSASFLQGCFFSHWSRGDLPRWTSIFVANELRFGSQGIGSLDGQRSCFRCCTLLIVSVLVVSGDQIRFGFLFFAEAGEEGHSEPTEDVVDDALCDADFWVGRMSVWFEPGVAELVDKDFERNAVLQGDGDSGTEAIHQAADGATFFCHGDEDFTGSAIWVESDVDVAFVAGDTEFVGDRVSSIGQSFATWLEDDFLGDLFDDLGRCCVFGFLPFGLCREWLALFRAIAVDSDSFQAEFPTPVVCIFDILDGGIVRHIHSFADSTREEWLGGGHHLDVGLPTDASRTVRRGKGAVEDR